MNRKDFFEKVAKVVAPEDLPKIQWAYWLTKEVHRNQKRDEGERYFEHCRRVSCAFMAYYEENIKGRNWPSRYLADTIITALLHDCIEDGFMPHSIIENLFGGIVARDTGILSKINAVYNLLTGAVEDKVRISDEAYYKGIGESHLAVRYIKLFDRLDNLQSMHFVWPKDRQQAYIAETEKYILPIAKATDEKLFNELVAEIEKIKKKGGE